MSRQLLREPRKRGAGREQHGNTQPRAPRECRMKAESRFSRHFAARHGTPCGRNPSPASPPRGEWLAKGQTGFARGRTPSRAGKVFRSLVFPFFQYSQELPCGKKVSSLRKAVLFFAESGSFLCGKRFCFYREKTTAGTEKCSIQTVPSPVF